MPPNSSSTWYCHECGSEMRPLMVPDPHCPSCNGTFVEVIESPQNDPRAWQHIRPDEDGDFDDLAAQLRDIFPGPRPGGFTLSINRTSSPGGGTRTFAFGRPRLTDTRPDRVMPLTEFLEETAGDGGRRAMRDEPGPSDVPQRFMINQILGMLAQRYTDQRGPGTPNPFVDLLGVHQGGPEEGRFGDYVLNQQALDHIMTALMENSNAHRPVPATERVIENLDHQVLEEGSPLLEKDCAICKDQFSLQTEDPDEQVIITLPCKHPFHSPCILPWLKQNGTCPTCRHQLVPQPGSTPSANNSAESGSGPSTRSTNLPQRTSPANPWTRPEADSSSSNRSAQSRNRGHGESPERSDSGGSFFGIVGDFLHSLAGSHQNSGPVPSGSNSGPESLPGGWEPDHSPRSDSGNRSSHARDQPNRHTGGTYSYSNLGPRRSQTTPSHDQLGSTYGASHNTSSSSRNSGGNSTSEWIPYNPGDHRRGSQDRERERRRDRDRNSQRRNTYPWEDGPALD